MVVLLLLLLLLILIAFVAMFKVAPAATLNIKLGAGGVAVDWVDWVDVGTNGSM